MKSEVILQGCAPIPLAHYLKGLGVLRLVSEQEDSSAKALWKNDTLLLSSSFDADSLVEFFLQHYRPTAILNPWNGDGGFFADSRSGAIDVLKQISASKSERFAAYHKTISAIRAAFASKSDHGEANR